MEQKQGKLQSWFFIHTYFQFIENKELFSVKMFLTLIINIIYIHNIRRTLVFIVHF